MAGLLSLNPSPSWGIVELVAKIFLG